MNKILFPILLIFLLAACSDGNDPVVITDPAGDIPPVIDDSSGTSAKSHNNGDTCIKGGCHDGNKTQAFVTAGSVYVDSAGSAAYVDGASVHLYSDQARTDLLQSIAVDQLGNFYSAQALDYGTNGLYVTLEVFNPAGNIFINKPTPVPHGRCNICHNQLNNDKEFRINIEGVPGPKS